MALTVWGQRSPIKCVRWGEKVYLGQEILPLWGDFFPVASPPPTEKLLSAS